MVDRDRVSDRLRQELLTLTPDNACGIKLHECHGVVKGWVADDNQGVRSERQDTPAIVHFVFSDSILFA